MALSADIVLVAPSVLTMDPEQPVVEAVACRDGRIAYVGSVRGALATAGVSTKILEFAEGVALPGFVDAHTHFARIAELARLVDLGPAPDRRAAIAMLATRARDTPPGAWVVGWNWDESRWPDRAPLASEELDEVSRDHPVLARRVCGHLAVINGAGRARVSLPVQTVRADGSGTLTEDAADEAWRQAAPPLELAAEGLAAARSTADRLGIAAVHDMAGARDVQLWSRAARDQVGLPAARLYLFRELLDHADALGLGPLGGDVSFQGVKMYTDGSLGAFTASLEEPFAYQGKTTEGALLVDAKTVAAVARQARGLGLQVAAHAIGNRAVRETLDGFRAAGLTAADRPRIEHAECVTDDLVARFTTQGVVASMQPNFIGNWGQPGALYSDRLGDQAVALMNPLRALLDAGVPVALGSDGMPYGPLYGVHWAVNAPLPRQRLRVEQALLGATATASWAGFQERERGSLRLGLAADIAVLSDDPRRRPSAIKEMRVTCNVRGGRVVHKA